MASITQLTPITSAVSDDKLVIHDTSANITGRIDKSQFLSDYTKNIDLLPTTTAFSVNNKIMVYDVGSSSTLSYSFDSLLDNTFNKLSSLPTVSSYNVQDIFIPMVNLSFSGNPAKMNLGGILDNTAVRKDFSNIPDSPTIAFTDKVPLYRPTDSTTKSITIGDLFEFSNTLDFSSKFYDFTLSSNELHKMVKVVSSSDVIVTIPSDLGEYGNQVHFRQAGNGKVIFVGGEGVTIIHAEGTSFSTRAKNSIVTLYKDVSGQQEWVLFGDLAKE